MKFFIDTADLDQIREAANMGVLDGVTTNPSLMAKVGVSDVKGHYLKICEMVDGDVSAEVISTDYEGIVEEGRELAKIHPNITVKIPMIKEGVKAISTLAAEGIKINCTLIFNPLQALVAAKAGAKYVSPFIGRLDDIGQDGMNLIEEVRVVFDNYGLECQILAASVRHTQHLLNCALVGADVATMPLSVIENMIKHPLTDKGLAKFLADHKKMTESVQ
ncbi:fructose-6-phosphate aldolase [Pontibacter sp. G13]|uniref:fructose-6-phosphate aldolase n=1 Tax=Pontibacter sp. G13 TaxID=3074898 RepID=UPI00288AF142|nr:fructose-6-phosphate aldolase [Pontibacter sp. G13]WNJ20381.1 fructose-6-phosphate aldolase [Pontibacter sp. G13]